MRWRWPWQTREDALIRALDKELATAKVSSEHLAELTRNARREAERKMRGDDAAGS